MPCKTVPNKLDVFNLPTEIETIRKLQIAHYLRNQKKIIGTICNIPVDNLLPRAADCNALNIVKLIRKVGYRGHFLFEVARPDFLHRVLSYLNKI